MQDELNEFVKVGADLAITKPMKPTVLDALLRLIREEGPHSHPGKKLVYDDDTFRWMSAS
jgi:DNA-binding response OmpR family regulator